MLANASPGWLFWSLLAIALLLVIAITMAAVRGGTVAGPMRLPPGEQRGTLAGIFFLGLAVWMLVPSFWAAAIRAQEPPAADAPTTRPAALFTPQQSVLVSVIAGSGAATVMILGNLMFRPGGLGRLGLSLAALPRGVWIGFLAGLLIVPLTFISAMLTDQLWRRVGLDHPEAHEMLQILGAADAPLLRMLIYVSAIAVAPLFEELLFRGHAQTLLVAMLTPAASPARQFDPFDPPPPSVAPSSEQPPTAMPPPAFRPRGSAMAPPSARWIAIIITSFTFALVHGAVWMMPPIFFLSLCLGYLYERTANLWSVVFVHLLFNAVNITLFVNVANR
jgi:membrane protease YdiL (CAAX protease family)